MRITKLLLAILMIGPVWADEEYQAFKQGIRESEAKIDYRNHLLNHMAIDALVPSLDEGGRPDSIREGSESGVDSGQKALGHAASQGKERERQADEQEKRGTQSRDVNQVEGEGKGFKDSDNATSKTEDERKTSKSARAHPSRPVKYAVKKEVHKREKFRHGIANDAQFSDLKKVVKFGIPIGTEIKVRLIKGASNALSSHIPLIVEEDVIGDFKVLGKGSTLFGRADTLVGSPRLFIQLMRGITRYDHEEFSLTGSIYALDGNAGLEAEVISDGRTLARARNTASDQIASGLVGMVPQDNVFVQAGKQATQKIITEKSDETDMRTGIPAYILQSQPQRATLIVEETF